MVFYNLRALRIDNDIKQQALANVLGIAQNTYSQYETGKIAFTDEMLLKLAKYYHTSVDYLLGLTPVSSPYPTTK